MKRCQGQRAFRNNEIADSDNSSSKQQRGQARRRPAGYLGVVAQPIWQRMCQDPSQRAEPPRHSRPRLSILPSFSCRRSSSATAPARPGGRVCSRAQWRKDHFPSCGTTPFILFIRLFARRQPFGGNIQPAPGALQRGLIAKLAPYERAAVPVPELLGTSPGATGLAIQWLTNPAPAHSVRGATRSTERCSCVEAID